jgi:hypothetical protein
MHNSPRYPDFLCIGAQRAGTSWLYSNLRQHPQIWLPPLKELHYFDTNWPSQTSRSNQWNRRWLRHVRHLLSRLKDPRQVLKPESKWLFRYLFLPRNDRWYGSLFPNDRDLIVGELTPRYATLDENVVAHMAKLMPQAKIIYILRNPIERSWSAAAMRLEKQCAKHIDQASDEDIRQAIDWMEPRIRADYVKHIDLWTRHFGSENLFAGFFEEIAEEPSAFLNRICELLRVGSSVEWLPNKVQNPVNALAYQQIPAQHLRHLADLHSDQIRLIHERFANRYTQDWLDMANRYTSSDQIVANHPKGKSEVA